MNASYSLNWIFFKKILFLILTGNCVLTSLTIHSFEDNASKGDFCALKALHLNRYNITASDEKKFVWFRVAKVGTRSILEILNKNQVPFSINDYEVSFNPKRYKNYFKFAFVRNPWDRVVSCYMNKVVPNGPKYYQECLGKGFDYFVDFISKKDLTTADAHIRLQTSLIPIQHVNFIGRLETFADDLQYIAKVIGLQLQEIPRKNRTAHDHYSKYYTEKTKKIIAEKYKKDIEAFGYEFETP